MSEFALQPTDDGFERFWEAYPEERRLKPTRARAAWKALNPAPDLVARILKVLEIHKRSKQWQDVRFIPHPASWLNARRWEDPVEGYTDPERCPECGKSWRIHLGYGDGTNAPNERGSYCPS